jgi:ABC-type antimicrobial peptide transport system permease subunit
VIVGVVGDVNYHGLTKVPAMTVYVPFAQRPFPFRVLNVLVRTTGDPGAFAPDLRRAMNDVDHEIAVVRLQTLEDVITSATDQPAFRTLMVGGIAAIAILLTLVGMTGVLAYSVSQRTREIGVRVALGASSPAIRAMVVGEAARVGLAGIATGLAAAFVLARLLATELYGVSASDPLSFAAAALLVSLVTLGASYFPARHASNVDPLVALRSE